MRERVFAKKILVRGNDPVSGQPRELEIVDMRSTPTHFSDASDPGTSRAEQIQGVLDAMHAILSTSKAEMIVELVDDAVASLSVRPDFTYHDVALSLQQDRRFAFQGGIVSLAEVDDPWGAYQLHAHFRTNRN